MSAAARIAATLRRFGFARNRAAVAAEPAAPQSVDGSAASSTDRSHINLASPSADHRAGKSGEWGGGTSYPAEPSPRTEQLAPPLVSLQPSEGTRRSPSSNPPASPAADPPALLRPNHPAATRKPAPAGPSRPCRRVTVPASPRILIATAAALLALALPASALADNTPSVTTNPAEEVGVTTAKLSGAVNPQGQAGAGNTSWRIEYTPAGQGAWSTINAGTIEAPASEEANPVEVEVLAGFSGELQPGQAYEFRLAAENGAGQAASSRFFETQPAVAPTLTANDATALGYTIATLHGEIDPEGGNVNPIGPEAIPLYWRFEVNQEGQGWSPVGNFNEISAPQAESNAAIAVSEALPAGTLQPGKSYESRLHAFYLSFSREAESGPSNAFQTKAATAPTLANLQVSSITDVAAHVSAPVNPNAPSPGSPEEEADINAAFRTEWQYQCSGECFSPYAKGVIDPPDATDHVVTSDTETLFILLVPNTEYTLKLIASNSGGTAEATKVFTTPAILPTAVTASAVHIGSDTAALSGSVNPHNSLTTYYFLWGTEDCSANPCQSIPVSEGADAGSGAKAIGAYQVLTGLTPETSYHFLLVAHNSAGTVEGADRTFTTAPPDQGGECSNEARRSEQPLSSVLPDCRVWELATPDTDKDILIRSGRTQAATGESPGLPMAVKFSSLGGFADIEGIGNDADYIAARDGAAGTTSGWTVHGITPPQEPKSFAGALQFVSPLYELFTPDLSKGIFRSFTPLPGTSENAKEIPNLYLRDDVRTPGPGSYQFLTDSALPQPPLTEGNGYRPWIAGASSDLEHIVFESRLNLTADATGSNVKLYKSDDGALRLLRANGACAGASSSNTMAVCSIAGVGQATNPYGPAYLPNVISSDGSRINLTSPFFTAILNSGPPNARPGVVSKLFQLDDQGTAATDDDAVIQLSMSEKPSPEPAKAAIYEIASTDGNRVFFRSAEQLTEAPGSGLYMWERQNEDETQQLNVDATAGQFSLTAQTQPSYGPGELTEGSAAVFMNMENPGSFTVGQTIEGEGIPAGTTVTEVGTFKNNSQKKIVISNPATETATRNLTASFAATTGSLPWNATAAEVQSALEGLASIGAGNVSVSGGPGGTAPFTVEFTGALAGVNVMQLSSDASGLTGGASTATVSTTNDVHNLTLIGEGATGVLGASDDGHRVYFAIVDTIKLWQDDGSPIGSILHVASLFPEDGKRLTLTKASWVGNSLLSSVTTDGRFLFFEASDGSDLPPGYQHGPCDANANGTSSRLCSEAYLYRADTSTPTEPDIVCASCKLSEPESPGNTTIDANVATGTSTPVMYTNRVVSDDGRYVFFNTDEKLAEEDTNGTLDVYEYDTQSGEAHLISSGTDSASSYLTDSSADGTDVFFATREQLSGWDEDQGYDLYDARVGGGFPEPPPSTASCNGADSCHGSPVPQPPGSPVGSASLNGDGNVNGRRPCRKGSRAATKGGRTRCVKKHRKHSKRHARNNRRAGH